MKCISFIFFILLTVFITLGATTTIKTSPINAGDFLRIHIRANSDETSDQLVKYTIKNKVVEAITPLIANCNSKEDIINHINLNKQKIEKVSNQILLQHSFTYQTKVLIKKEYFPTRMYNNVVLQSGVYDAIILELGEAKGNNWWCVVYPPLCFVNDTGNANIIYKSKLLELIEKFFK